MLYLILYVIITHFCFYVEHNLRQQVAMKVKDNRHKLSLRERSFTVSLLGENEGRGGGCVIGVEVIVRWSVKFKEEFSITIRLNGRRGNAETMTGYRWSRGGGREQRGGEEGHRWKGFLCDPTSCNSLC